MKDQGLIQLRCFVKAKDDCILHETSPVFEINIFTEFTHFRGKKWIQCLPATCSQLNINLEAVRIINIFLIQSTKLKPINLKIRKSDNWETQSHQITEVWLQTLTSSANE